MASSKPNKNQYDIVIVGGSTAGMAAAMGAARAHVPILLIDSGEPRNRVANHLHNFLGQDGKQPLEWLEIARQNLSQYQQVVESLTGRVTDIEKPAEIVDDYLFQLVIDNLHSVRARRVILATGIQDYFEGYPKGIQEHWGSIVQHCPFCAGYEHTDRSWALVLSPVSVFPHLMMGSMFNYFNREHPLHVFTNGHAELVGDLERQAYKANGVVVCDDKITQVTPEEGKAQDENGAVIHLESGKTYSFSLIYIKPPFRQSPLVTKLGIALNPMFKTVNIDMFGATNVPGVFVGGDAAEPRQALAFANAQGGAAGAGAVLSLAQAKWGAACAAAGVVLPAPAAAPAAAPATAAPAK